MIYLLILSVVILFALYVNAEIMHCRKGHNVYDWTKKLVNWIDK